MSPLYPYILHHRVEFLPHRHVALHVHTHNIHGEILKIVWNVNKLEWGNQYAHIRAYVTRIVIERVGSS
jgi:hypothetical protein